MIVDIIILTLIFETFSIISRVKFGSMKKIYKKSKMPVRIHHGYVGILLLLVFYLIMPVYSLLVIGWSLFLSDAVNHFIVLPIWVRKTEFP